MHTLPTPTPLAVSSYACRRCGKVLFRADEIQQVRPLWDLGEERNEVFVLRGSSELPSLRRYDTSLHEGWYCCRFALMRMTTDKFGTGDHLLAYVGDVVRVGAGQLPQPEGRAQRRQLELTSADFDELLGKDRGDHLSVVKLGASWCPPCRLIDSAIAKMSSQVHEAVRFYEVDVDAEPALAERFHLRSLPTLRFWYRGQPLQVRSRSIPSVDGALVGGMTQRTLEKLCAIALESARAGERAIELP